MNLAIFLVLASAIALIAIVCLTVPQKLGLSLGADQSIGIQPVDIEAFRNLIDPAEDEYLRRRLPGREFRSVQRKRLEAMAAYVRTAGHNASVLIRVGQAAMGSANPETARAGHELAQQAVALRSNTTFALLRIYGAWAWPGSDSAANPILQRYERLSDSAMLLGRLQNPGMPVRLSVN